MFQASGDKFAETPALWVGGDRGRGEVLQSVGFQGAFTSYKIVYSLSHLGIPAPVTFLPALFIFRRGGGSTRASSGCEGSFQRLTQFLDARDCTLK
jgi:hypothetical protein